MEQINNKTKMRTKIIINIFLLMVLSACVKDKTIRIEYPGGITFIGTPVGKSDSLLYGRWYFENGNLSQEGMVRNRHLDGLHRLYFEDGVLQWEGYIDNSVIRSEHKFTWEGMEKYLQYLTFEKREKRQIGDTLRFRLVMPEVHPQFYLVCDLDYNFLGNPENPYLFTYRYIPTESGRVFLRILFMNEDGAFIIGNPEFIIDAGIEVE
jgi:hypothetical protein